MSKVVSAVEYIMEDPREAMRLEAKVDAHAWVQKYLAHRVGAGAEVLSVGCGPGVILREVVALNKSIQATGVDISEDRIREAKQRHRGVESMNFVRGDSHAMELPSNRFDLVYSRMLLEYLRNKEQAVQETVRVCRPGGAVLLQDLDGQLLWHFPEDAGIQQTAEKVVNALAATGFDPYVGRKLFWLAQKAGLTNLEAQVECYHLIAGKIEPQILRQWELKLEIAKPQLAQIFGG